MQVASDSRTLQCFPLGQARYRGGTSTLGKVQWSGGKVSSDRVKLREALERVRTRGEWYAGEDLCELIDRDEAIQAMEEATLAAESPAPAAYPRPCGLCPGQ